MLGPMKVLPMKLKSGLVRQGYITKIHFRLRIPEDAIQNRPERDGKELATHPQRIQWCGPILPRERHRERHRQPVISMARPQCLAGPV